MNDASIILKKFKIFVKKFAFWGCFFDKCLCNKGLYTYLFVVSFDPVQERYRGSSGCVSMCKSGGKGFLLEAGGWIWYKKVNETGYFWFLVGGM